MGYYASHDGTIVLKEMPPKEIINACEDALSDARYYENDNSIYISGYAKYYDDEVRNCLNLIANYVKEGCIEFTGEDYHHWQFKFIDGEWEEQDGEIVYDSIVPEKEQEEFIGQIIDIFDDEINPENPVFTGSKFNDVHNKLVALMKGWRVF